jgi:lipopolysaccharide biosynthesis regulator YciM
VPTIEIEIWWLLALTLLFFALGWIAARIDIKHLLRESRALPLSYFRGLNFLLNEQPDKAIESFIEVVKVDPQTIDLHFALGNLFRRQGEIDRAIRMHQNLLDRPDLPPDKRETAVFELAQDFHRAGLLDRAEDLFTKLDGSAFEHQALGSLLQIYEQEKDWPKAISATRRMETLAKRPYFKEIAHYHCELAQAFHRPGAGRIQALHAGDDAAGRPRGATGQRCRGNRIMAAHRVAESGVPGPGRRPAVRRIPPHRRHCSRHPGAEEL